MSIPYQQGLPKEPFNQEPIVNQQGKKVKKEEKALPDEFIKQTMQFVGDEMSEMNMPGIGPDDHLYKLNREQLLAQKSKPLSATVTKLLRNLPSPKCDPQIRELKAILEDLIDKTHEKKPAHILSIDNWAETVKEKIYDILNTIEPADREELIKIPQLNRMIKLAEIFDRIKTNNIEPSTDTIMQALKLHEPELAYKIHQLVKQNGDYDRGGFSGLLLTSHLMGIIAYCMKHNLINLAIQCANQFPNRGQSQLEININKVFLAGTLLEKNNPHKIKEINQTIPALPQGNNDGKDYLYLLEALALSNQLYIYQRETENHQDRNKINKRIKELDRNIRDAIGKIEDPDLRALYQEFVDPNKMNYDLLLKSRSSLIIKAVIFSLVQRGKIQEAFELIKSARYFPINMFLPTMVAKSIAIGEFDQAMKFLSGIDNNKLVNTVEVLIETRDYNAALTLYSALDPQLFDINKIVEALKDNEDDNIELIDDLITKFPQYREQLLQAVNNE